MRKGSIVGKKIVGVRHMTKEELESEGWTEGNDVIVLDDGSLIYASSDEEGNESGCLIYKQGKVSYYV